jgi:hypothetical protein
MEVTTGGGNRLSVDKITRIEGELYKPHFVTIR